MTTSLPKSECEDRRLVLVGAVVVALVYVCLHAPWLTAPLSHGDDQLEVVFVNGLDASWKLLGTDVFGLFRPVKNILFALFSALSIHHMAGCRVFAVLIGLFSFACVWRFSVRILSSTTLALVAASIWLLSPTLVSSVAWLSCVNIQLMCAFAALAGCFHFDDKPWKTACCLLLACLSYEQAVVLGPCLFVADFFLRRERLNKRSFWMIYIAYAVVTLVYLGVRTWLGSSQMVNGSLVGCSRLHLSWASAYLTGLHFSTWFWPFGRMAVFGGYANGQVPSWMLAGCWGLTVSALAASWCLRNRFPRLALGVVWAWVAFLPLGNLAGVRNGPYGDYYLGLSSLGFAWLGAVLVERLWQNNGRLRLVVLVLAAGFLSVRLLSVVEAFSWARLWATPELAYRATVRTFPKAYFAHVTLAKYLCDHREYAEAEKECIVAESLMGGEPMKLASIHLVRAILAILWRADAAEAEKWLKLAAEEDSSQKNLRLVHFYRGCVLEDLRNDSAGAEREYGLAVPQDDPWNVDSVRAADRYARLLAMRGQFDRAIGIWERAAVISPTDAVIGQNLKTAKRLANRK